MYYQRQLFPNHPSRWVMLITAQVWQLADIISLINSFYSQSQVVVNQ
jgi:hypothetical protein